jgi:hypothetical protein
VYLVDRPTGRVRPVVPPARQADRATYLPAWANTTTLLYVEQSLDADDGPASLMRFDVATGEPAVAIAPLDLPTTPADAIAFQQGLLSMFSANRGAWLYRDGQGAVRVLDLASLREETLPAGTSAAAWWEPPWLLTAGADQIALFRAGGSAEDETPPVRVRLLSGRWAPRHVDAIGGGAVLVGIGDRPDRLAVYRMRFVASD